MNDDLVTKFNMLKQTIQSKEKELIQAQTKQETYANELNSYLNQLKELGFDSVEDAQAHLQDLEASINKDLQTLELNLSNPSTLKPQPTSTPTPTPTSEITLSTPVQTPTPDVKFDDITNELEAFM